jgi:hypothetical protein
MPATVAQAVAVVRAIIDLQVGGVGALRVRLEALHEALERSANANSPVSPDEVAETVRGLDDISDLSRAIGNALVLAAIVQANTP